jgi:hypothetical protein
MKFNQLERAVFAACAAVFLLSTADGMGMTWVCPASGPGGRSDRVARNERTISATGAILASRRPSGDVPGLLGLCHWDEHARNEEPNSLLASVPPAPASQQGIPCPVEAGG